MRRAFIKNKLFTATDACFLGEDFIASGHWVMHVNYASNRKKFGSVESTKNFLRDVETVKTIEDSFANIVERYSKDDPLSPTQLSDLCLGNAALLTLKDSILTAQAQYINVLKGMIGPDDKLMANSKILVALDAKGNYGLMIMLYDVGDLITSIRNRHAVQLLSETMELNKRKQRN